MGIKAHCNYASPPCYPFWKFSSLVSQASRTSLFQLPHSGELWSFRTGSLPDATNLRDSGISFGTLSHLFLVWKNSNYIHLVNFQPPLLVNGFPVALSVGLRDFSDDWFPCGHPSLTPSRTFPSSVSFTTSVPLPASASERRVTPPLLS